MASVCLFISILQSSSILVPCSANGSILLELDFNAFPQNNGLVACPSAVNVSPSTGSSNPLLGCLIVSAWDMFSFVDSLSTILMLPQSPP